MIQKGSVMKRIITLTLAITLMAAVGYFGVRGARSQDHGQGHEQGPPEVLHHINPHDVGFDLTEGTTATLSPISNHGGAVINTPTVYLIWYGNWNQNNGSDTPTGQQIVRDFASNIGNSHYFNINTTYPDVSGQVVYGGDTTDAYSRGRRLRDSDIRTIVSNAINTGGVPYNSEGVYFVLTSSDVSEISGFCTRYCGWHT